MNLIKCCRCKKKHLESDRVEVLNKKGWTDLVCPSCNCKTFTNVKKEEKEVKRE